MPALGLAGARDGARMDLRAPVRAGWNQDGARSSCVGRREPGAPDGARMEPGAPAGSGDAVPEIWVSQEPSRAALGFGMWFLMLAVFLSCHQSIRVPEQPAVPSAPDPQGGRGQ